MHTRRLHDDPLRPARPGQPCPVCGGERGCHWSRTIVICARVNERPEKTTADGRWLYKIATKERDTSAMLLRQVERMFKPHWHFGDRESRATAKRVWEDLARWVGQHRRLRCVKDLLPAHVRDYLTYRIRQGDSATTLQRTIALVELIHAHWPKRRWRLSLREHLYGARSERSPGDTTATLRDQVERAVRRMNNRKLSTRAKYRKVALRFATYLGRHLNDGTGRQTLRTVHAGHVQRYIDWRRAQGASRATLVNELYAIQAVFEFVEGHPGWSGQPLTERVTVDGGQAPGTDGAGA